MIDKNLEAKIKLLRGKFRKYSVEDELICRVSGRIHSAAESLIPNNNLLLAQDYVELYEERVKKGYTPNGNLVKGLWEIVNDAWNRYGEVEVIRT